MRLFSRYGLMFDGNGKIEIGDAIQVRSKVRYTMLVQFKMNSAGTVVRKAGEYKLDVLSNGNVSFTDENGRSITSSGVNVLGSWCCAVVRIEYGGVCDLFVDRFDRKFSSSWSGSNPVGTSSLVLMENANGVIDRFMFWGVKLSDVEVQDVFDRKLVGRGLDCFFAIDEGRGDKVWDVVNYAYSGSITNGVWVDGRDVERVINQSLKVVLVKRT